MIAVSDDPPDWFVKAVGTPGEPISAVVDGVRVQARCWGERGPGLVLVHGGAAHGRWWDHLAPILAEDYRVVAVDLSGHGDSEHRAHYSAQVWAPEVLALAEAAGLRPPYFALAHSIGGWVTLRAALLSPGALAGVVLIDSTVRRRSDEHTDKFGARALHPPRVADTEQELLERFRVVPDDPWIQPYVLEHVARNSVRRVGEKWLWKLDRRVFAHAEWDAEELLAAAPCPVGVLRAEQGMITDTDSRRTAELLGARGSIVTIPETGHHAHLDAPMAVLTAARALLASWQPLERPSAGQPGHVAARSIASDVTSISISGGTVETTPDGGATTSATSDIEAIKILKARYFRFVDTKDWTSFRELFTPDARFEFTGEAGTFESVQAFIDYVEPGLKDLVTVHHGHMPEVELTGPETAEAVFAMEDRLRFPDGNRLVSVHGFGHYHDTFRRTADGWRIESVRLTRLARDVVRRDGGQ